MLDKIKRISSNFLMVMIAVFSFILTGSTYAQETGGDVGLNPAGVREVVIAGLIIAFLTAVYSVILTQKDENESGDGCACGKKSKFT